jgi:hypothetical protein
MTSAGAVAVAFVAQQITNLEGKKAAKSFISFNNTNCAMLSKSCLGDPKNPKVVRVPPSIGIFCGHILGIFLRDVLLTRNELKGLMNEMLTSAQAPNGETKFSD